MKILRQTLESQLKLLADLQRMTSFESGKIKVNFRAIKPQIIGSNHAIGTSVK
jgi:hypothetical protein